jgi:hypothetical protein
LWPLTVRSASPFLFLKPIYFLILSFSAYIGIGGFISSPLFGWWSNVRGAREPLAASLVLSVCKKQKTKKKRRVREERKRERKRIRNDAVECEEDAEKEVV